MPPTPNSRGRGLDAALGAALVAAALVYLEPLPWRATVGAVGLVSLLWRARPADSRAALATAAGLALATGVVFFVRQAVFAPADFHQNGQGPLWIDYALGRISSYGPGHFELFNWTVRGAAGDPDTPLWQFQAALGALWPLWAWLLARSLGAGRVAAGAAFVLVAADPAAIRVSASESYFASCISLLLPAAVALSLAFRGGWWRAREAGDAPGGAQAANGGRDAVAVAVGLAAAALLASQVARIHPVSWIPIGGLPIVALVGPGRASRRLLSAVAAGLALAVGVGLLSGGAMRAVLEGSLGTRWEDRLTVEAAWTAIDPYVRVVGPVALALAVASRERTRALLAAVGLLAVVVVSRTTDLIGSGANPSITAAYHRLFLAHALAPAAALLVTVRGRIWVRGALLALFFAAGMVWNAVGWPVHTTLFADTLEARLTRQWRAQLEPGARVAYLERHGNRLLILPYYGAAGTPEGMRLQYGQGDDASQRAALTSGAPALYYQRTSLCSMAEVAEFCALLEADLRLEPIATEQLPARQSMRDFGYAGSSVEIGLYRLLGR